LFKQQPLPGGEEGCRDSTERAVSEFMAPLDALAPGGPATAAQLLPAVYHDLRRLAAAKLAHEPPGQTLEPTALVHEAFLRLTRQDGGSLGQPRPLLRGGGRGHAPHPRRKRQAQTCPQEWRRHGASSARGGRTAGPPTARRPAGLGRGPDATRRRRPRVGPVG